MSAVLQSRPPADAWKEFEGIPLCHVPATPQEEAELAAKGVCRCE